MYGILLGVEMNYEQNLLLDCWIQFAYEGKVRGKPKRSAGGLSVLEDVEGYLLDNGLIDDNGNPTPKTEI